MKVRRWKHLQGWVWETVRDIDLSVDPTTKHQMIAERAARYKPFTTKVEKNGQLAFMFC